MRVKSASISAKMMMWIHFPPPTAAPPLLKICSILAWECFLPSIITMQLWMFTPAHIMRCFSELQPESSGSLGLRAAYYPSSCQSHQCQLPHREGAAIGVGHYLACALAWPNITAVLELVVVPPLVWCHRDKCVRPRLVPGVRKSLPIAVCHGSSLQTFCRGRWNSFVCWCFSNLVFKNSFKGIFV